MREYSKDGNATQAAIRAGYAKSTANREGTRLLSNAVIATAVGRQAQKAEAAVDVSRERILKELVGIAYAAIDGDLICASDKVAAINRINKMQGYEIQRHEVTGAHGAHLAIAVDLSALSDAELAAAEAIAARIAPAPTDAAPTDAANHGQ